MKQNFETIMSEIFASEGGYVDHPKDPGGATNLGITRRTLAAWRGIVPFSNLPKSEVKNLSKKEALSIYAKEYWQKVRGDDLPTGVDCFVMDFGVNSGPSRSIKGLQTVVGVPADGVIGPLTLEAVRKTDPLKIVDGLYDYRMRFLMSLGTWSTFGRGWKSRVDKIHRLSQNLIGFKTPHLEKKTNLLELLIKIILKLIGK